MLKRHAPFTIAFLLIAGANIFAQFDVALKLNLFIKPLICISLAIYLVNKVNLAAGFNRLVLAGLVFSLFGDCFLLFAGALSTFFILGLVSFLIVHVLYSLAFFRDFKNDPQSSKLYGHLMLFLIGVFSLSFYTWIRDYLGDLRIPVMAYIFVISIMAILAGYRYRRVNLLSFRLIYFGAIFFVISDSVLAYNKFVESISYSGVIIMATYILAQYLIVMGSVERVVIVSGKNESVFAGTAKQS